MPKRKLLIALTVAGLFVAAFGSSTMSASADQRTCLVTTVAGQQITITAPACTVDQVAAQVPGAIASVQDVTAPRRPARRRPRSRPSRSTRRRPPARAARRRPPARTRRPRARRPRPRRSRRRPSRTRSRPPARPAATLRSRSRVRPRPAATPRRRAKDKADAAKRKADALTNADGSPADTNPSLSLALPGPAPIGVPNFFIDKFRIPPFLLPIYQAAGIEYGVRWEVLAAINEIETDYGRNLNVSSAGAVGWMQFMPSTWKQWGVDANRDGRKDPFNPVDAIFGAARYLKAAGADKDVRRAIFAYNHAGWYVDSVLMRARLIGGLPADLVGSLSGLTQGHFPVHAKARYADAVDTKKTKRDQEGQRRRPGHELGEPQGHQHLRQGRLPRDRHAGRAHREDGQQQAPGQVPHAARRLRQHLHVRASEEALGLLPGAQGEDGLARGGQQGAQAPEGRPEADRPRQRRQAVAPRAKAAAKPPRRRPPPRSRAADAPTMRKERLFANPGRPTAFKSGGEEQLLNAGSSIPGYTTYKSYFSEVYGLKRSDVRLKQMKVGSKVIAGTILGRLGKTQTGTSPHMLFELRPAGKDAPRIDPKPILDGWKLLESTAIYRAAGTNPFLGPNAKDPSIGQILLMSKEALQRRVLTDSRVEDLRLRPPRHPRRHRRPPRAGHPGVPDRQRPEADRLRPGVRPRPA